MTRAEKITPRSVEKAPKAKRSPTQSKQATIRDHIGPGADVMSLSAQLAEGPKFQAFRVWLVGDSPLITHAWSQKAKTEMLQKQVKAPKPGKEPRDPQADFVSSLYPMGDGGYGFPATGIKNCILSAAHKDKGIARTATQSALWLHSELVRVMPALSSAICDMPLVRIYGSKPEMREDMVKVGSGLNKTASLAYRAQFLIWAIQFKGRFNTAVLNGAQIAFLIAEAGLAYGIGEWRNEKRGSFGSFHMAAPEEEEEWDAFVKGGPLPQPMNPFAIAAE